MTRVAGQMNDKAGARQRLEPGRVRKSRTRPLKTTDHFVDLRLRICAILSEENGGTDVAVLAGLPFGVDPLAGATAFSQTPTTSPQDMLDSFAGSLGYRFTILSNKVTEGCPDKPEQEYCYSARLDLTMPKTVPQTISKGEWSLYLGFVEDVLPLNSDTFTLTNLNGSLYRLTAKAGMAKPGTTYHLNLTGPMRFFSPFILMPNVYAVQEGLQPRVISSSRPKIDPESKLEELPFVTPFTDEARLATQRPDDATVWLTPERLFEQNRQRHMDIKAPEFIILPAPAKAAHLGGPVLDLKAGVRLVLHGVAADEIAPALAALARAVPLGETGTELSITNDPAMKPESYRISAKDGAIAISAADAAGASYALRSIGAAGGA
jgi:hexosaminidase